MPTPMRRTTSEIWTFLLQTEVKNVLAAKIQTFLEKDKNM